MKTVFYAIIFALVFNANLTWSSSKPTRVEVLPGSTYEKLGIKTGDVVTNVDGQPVDSPEKAMQLYEGLRARKKMSVERPYKIRAKSLDAIMKRATATEKSDLRKLMAQIELIRVRTDDNGRTLFSVRKVSKNSLYSRLGIKPGDYVYAKNTAN